MTTWAWVYFWTLYSVPFICMSVFVCLFVFFSAILIWLLYIYKLYLYILIAQYLSVVLFPQVALATLGLWCSHKNFRIIGTSSMKNWYFDYTVSCLLAYFCLAANGLICQSRTVFCHSTEMSTLQKDINSRGGTLSIIICSINIVIKMCLKFFNICIRHNKIHFSPNNLSSWIPSKEDVYYNVVYDDVKSLQLQK